MPKRQVFYSFHYKNDVMRVQQIRNIGMIEDNKPVAPNAWEEVKKKGDKAIQQWIDDNMNYKSCVIVLIGQETAGRKWINYEIKKAWEEGKGLLGIYIHNLNCPNNGKSLQGKNPFDEFTFKGSDQKMSSYIKCYNPKASDPYNDIKANLENWIEEAIKQRKA